MGHNDNSKYCGSKDEFYKKMLEEHNRYITMKNPKGIKKYYINLEELNSFMDCEESYINRYTEEYEEPKDKEEELE